MHGRYNIKLKKNSFAVCANCRLDIAIASSSLTLTDENLLVDTTRYQLRH
jgi:hypothetical protein